MMNWKHRNGARLTLIAALVLSGVSPVLAEESPGMMERVETTAKHVGQKIEDKTKAVVKKVEDKHVVDKVGEKLKKAATKTAEGFEKAGKKIKSKLSD
ncbi:MAG: hypothetical protein H8K08_17570 [Nitrospira sp.]|nr:hypothetical protein [Nitrospira sp.]